MILKQLYSNKDVKKNFHCVHLFFSQVQLAFFFTIALNSLSGQLFTSVSLGQFSGVFHVLSFETFLCLLILLNFLCMNEVR